MEILNKFSENCRFCLMHTDNLERTPLNNFIGDKFKELTNWSLIKFQQFSNYSCQKCLKKLEICLKIREEFIENQKKLSDLYENSEIGEFSATSTNQDPVVNFDVLSTNFLEVDLINHIKEEAEDDLKSNLIFVKKETENFVDENEIEKLHKCDSCPESFKSENLLTAHKESHHIEPKLEIDLGKYEMMDVALKNPETLKSDSTVIKKAMKTKNSVKPKSQCKYCYKRIETSFLPRHIQYNHKTLSKVNRYFCDVCNKGYMTKYQILNHIRTHFNIKNYSCDQCDYQFFTKQGLRYHIKRQHDISIQKIHKCHLCEMSFKLKRNVTAHMAKHHPAEELYKCDLQDCGKVFYSKSTFSKHQRWHKAEICSVCSKPTLYLARHMKKHHNTGEKDPEFVTCTICGNLVRFSYFKNHMDIIHTNRHKFICDVCGKGFNQKLRIFYHLRSHFKIRDHHCDICNTSYTTRYGLGLHNKLKHLGMELKRIIRTCEYCGGTFDSKYKYEHHILMKHKGERNFKCDIGDCKRAYAIKRDLISHKKISHVEKVECPICFKMVKDVRKHKNLVHKENTVWYPCTYQEDGVACSKKFRDKCKVQTHIDGFHRDLRKYSCEECNACYQKQQDLKDHVRVVHQKIRIKCELCPTLVTQKKYYTRHIKLHHKEMDAAAKKAFLQKIVDTKVDDFILINT